MILFDLDGTLISAAQAQSRAYERALRTVFGLERGLEEVPHHGATMRMILTMFVGARLAADRGEEFAAVHASALEEELRESGRLIHGVRGCLQDLRTSGVGMGVITGNSAMATTVALRHFGIAEYMDTGFYGDTCDSRADLVANAVAAHPHPVIVGDTPLDVSAAHAHGCAAVAVATGSYPLEVLAATGPELSLPNLRGAADRLMAVGARPRLP